MHSLAVMDSKFAPHTSTSVTWGDKDVIVVNIYHTKEQQVYCLLISNPDKQW